MTATPTVLPTGAVAPGTPAGRRPSLRAFRVWRLDGCSTVFVLVSLLFGAAFAVITPAFLGQDEPGHFARAYAVDHGRLLPEPFAGPTGTNYGGPIPATAQALFPEAAALVSDHGPAQVARYRQLITRPLGGPLVTVGFPNTSAYSPVPYLPSVVGLRLAELVHGSAWTAILLMRLADLLAYTAIVWAALWTLRRQRFKWVVFVVATLPMTVFDASMVTADTLTNALALLLGALVVKATFLRRDLSRADTALVLATALLLPLVKPSYVLLVLAVLTIPHARYALPRLRRLFGWGSVGLGGLACGVWLAVTSPIQGAYHYMRPDVVIDPVAQARSVIQHPLHFLRIGTRTVLQQNDVWISQFVGHLGGVYLPVPLIGVLACVIAALLAAGMSERLSATRCGLASVAVLVLLNAAAIFLIEYLDWTHLGSPLIEGVQGRYFIPLAVPTAAVLLQLLPVRLYVNGVRAQRGVAVSIVILVVFALARAVLAYDVRLWH